MKRLPGCMAPVAVLLAGCGCTGPSQGAAPATPAVIRVEAAVARRTPVARVVEAVGTLAAAERVPISADIAGPVRSVLADLGDEVAAGQVMARLDDREHGLELEAARAALAQAEARLGLARMRYRRVEELRRSGAAAAEALDDARAALRVAEADAAAARARVGLAEKHLADTVVRSPVSGRVARRRVERGQYVRPGEVLFEVVVDPLEAQVAIPQAFAAQLREGLAAEIFLPGATRPAVEGVVRRVGPAADEATRSVPVEIEVPNPGGGLRPGQFAHVRIRLREEDAVVVPRAALQTFVGVHRVFVISPQGRVETRRVQVGADLGPVVEIAQGLRAGERVAVTQLERLAAGMRVEAVSTGETGDGGGDAS